jgi:glycosyltransferase involved in cell wall biosynthesis
LPSLSDISPNFLLECSALGKPAVATTEVGIKEDLGGVLYADSLNENAFVSALEKVISEPTYNSLCDACKNELSNEEWEKKWRSILSI